MDTGASSRRRSNDHHGDRDSATLRAMFPRSTPEACSGNASPRHGEPSPPFGEQTGPCPSLPSRFGVRSGGWGWGGVVGDRAGIRSYASAEITWEFFHGCLALLCPPPGGGGVVVGGGGPLEALHRLL